MTTNQTIDGVPRELAERFAQYAESGKVAEPSMIEELRALLDAPEQPKAEPVAWTEVDVLDFMSVALRHAEYSGLSPSDILDGLRYMAEKGKLATLTRPDSDEVVRLRCEVSKWRGAAGRLTHERDALRAHPQGEPVELFESVIGKNPQAFLIEPVYQVTESEVREFARLLSEQPAPVAAVPRMCDCNRGRPPFACK